ncbi:hypothetical protein M3O96_11595 [Aquiflexum sp. TKW24L]|uniref:hypothetical protein n=1 Tax=Aquiflexum sp. TKW24L TaxID=2942212 RepID=UPI0020BD5E7C|nr:hypothetical protein [Aquiflexum sp. TKW24L]MCL6259736.1 hypothetical protein [Aquiflexum sp. TKW24L]
MKKYLLSATFGFAMVAMLFSSGKVQGQASLPGSYYVSSEFCYCGIEVDKCRYDGESPCEVSSQIPCEEACGD